MARYIKLVIDNCDATWNNNGLISIEEVTVKNSSGTNYALNKNVTATSNQSLAAKITDGHPILGYDYNYVWMTAGGTGDNPQGSQDVVIDLGASYNDITTIEVSTIRVSGIIALGAYRLYSSNDNVAWELLATKTGGFGSRTDVFGMVVATPTVTVPTGLIAAAGDAKVTLSWTAVSGATGYNVKRSTIASGPYTTVGSNVASISYIDNSASNGTTYYYVVTALKTTDESGNSNEVSAAPVAGVVNPPNGNGNNTSPSGNFLLEVTLIDEHMREYQLTQVELDGVVAWYTAKSGGTGPAYYTLNKFLNRKDYLVFDKIVTFEITDFNN